MILPNHYHFRRYSDEELEEFVKDSPSHQYIAIAIRELNHRNWIKSEMAANDRAHAQQRADEDRHNKTLTQGDKILFWAKVGGIAAAIGTIGFLLKDTPLSKLLPSMSSRQAPLLIPYKLQTVAPSPMPTATESPSESPQASENPRRQ